MKKYFYTISHKYPNGFKPHGIVDVTDDGWISGGIFNLSPTPIEDYGDYILTDEPCDNPFNKWYNHLDK